MRGTELKALLSGVPSVITITARPRISLSGSRASLIQARRLPCTGSLKISSKAWVVGVLPPTVTP